MIKFFVNMATDILNLLIPQVQDPSWPLSSLPGKTLNQTLNTACSAQDKERETTRALL